MNRRNTLSVFNNLSEPAKASIWFTICSLVNKGIQFITVPIFTRLMSTAEYGQYSVFLSWQTIIIIFITLNLYSNVLNNGLLKYKNDKYGLISSFQGLTTIIAIVFLVISLTFKDFVCGLLKLPLTIIILMIIEIGAMPGFELWAAGERFEYKYKKVVGFTIAIAILNPVLGILFVCNSDEKGYARIISALLAQFLIYIVLYCYNFYKGNKFINLKYWKYALVLALPLVPHYLSQILLNQMDRIMISDFIGESEAAIYSVAYSGAMVMQIVGKSIQNSFTPWIYKNIEKENYSIIRSKSVALIVVIGIFNFCVLCFAPEAVWILGGVKYMEAVYVIPPVICSCVLIFIYSLFCVIEFYFENTKAMMIVSVFGAVLNYITNYIFIKKYGYIAAGYTTLLCYIVFVILHYIVMKSIMKKNKIESIYNIKFIFWFCCGFAVTSFILLMMYDTTLPRYLLFLIAVVFSIVKKKYILSAFRKG